MKLKQLIEENTTPAGRRFDVLIQALIVLSLLSFSIETVPGIRPEFKLALDQFELITVLIFSAEYLLRIIVSDRKLKFAFSFYGIIDLLAILPFYLASGIDLRAIRVFRLLRLLRAFKLLKYSAALQRFRTAFGMVKEELVVFLFTTALLVYVSSVGIYYFENEAQPAQFKSVFHALWWSVTTLTTVGYGDIYPVTVGGKIFTFFILLIGLGIVAVPTGLISSALTRCVKVEN